MALKSTLAILFGLLLLTSPIFAQVSPKPVADAEVRDSNSIRMRSLEFERVKRDVHRPRQFETPKETEIRYGKIKDDFEAIQKLQSRIVRAYTTGEKINYTKIRESAAELRNKASRLEANFFDIRSEIVTDKEPQGPAHKTAKDLIVELDRAIGAFVNSPVFQRAKIVDTSVLERSRLDLVKIVYLSDQLSRVEDNPK